MGKPSVPDVPDYTEIMAAAQASAEMANQIAQDQLDWAKVTYEENKAIIDPIMASYQQTLDFTQATAEADRARYEEVYQPLEDQLIAEAQAYASPERLELEMGRAQANVAQSMEASRQASAQELKSYGINPASPSYAGFDIAERTAQAATTVQAGEQAYQQTQAKADALRSEALNIGKGYPGMIASSYSTALTAGNQAVGGTNQTTQTASNAMTQPATYMNTANQSLDVWGSTINNSFNNQMAAYNAQVAQSSGVGSVLGTATSLAMPFIYSGMGITVAEGGEIMPRQSYAPGGAVPVQQSPSAGGRVDDVPAQLTAGEFVVPEDVVRWKGSEYFYKELDKARQSRMEMATPGGRPIPQPPKQQAGGQPQMGQMSGPRPQPMGHHPMPRPTAPMQGIPRYAAGGAVPAAPIRMQGGGQPYDYMTPAADPTVLMQNGAYQMPDGTWVIPPQPVTPAPPPPVQVDTSWAPMQQSTAPPAPTSPGQAFSTAALTPAPVPGRTQPSNATQYPSSYPQSPPPVTSPVAYSPLAAAPLTNTYQPQPLPNTYRPTSPLPPTAQAGRDVTADTRIQQAFNNVPPTTDPAGRIVQAFSNPSQPSAMSLQRGSPGSPQYAGSGSPGSPYRTPTYTPPFEKTPAEVATTASIPQPRPSRGTQARTARKPKSRPSESKSVKGKAKTAAKKRPIIKENYPYSTSAFEFARQGQDYLNRNKPRRAKRGAVDTPLMPSARSK